MNDGNGIRDRREELRLYCYYKVLTLSMKEYNVLLKWVWIICKGNATV